MRAIRWRDPEMNARKWVRALLTVIGMMALAYVALFPLVRSYQLAHPPRVVLPLTQIQAEKVELHTTDGVDLKGWFSAAAEPNGAAVVLAHGYVGNGAMMEPYARFLLDAGYHVLLFDFRAQGGSGGEISTIGWRERLDVLAAAHYLAARPEVDPERIGVLGVSMGGAAAIGAAAEDPILKAVVADSAYADFHEVIRRFGYFSIRGTPIHWTWGELYRLGGRIWTGEDLAEFKPVELIGQIAPRPVLIVHGELDNGACTVSDARALFDAAGEPKELWIVPRAGHGEALVVAAAEYRRRVIVFFDQAFGVQR